MSDFEGALVGCVAVDGRVVLAICNVLCCVSCVCHGSCVCVCERERCVHVLNINTVDSIQDSRRRESSRQSSLVYRAWPGAWVLGHVALAVTLRALLAVAPSRARAIADPRTEPAARRASLVRTHGAAHTCSHLYGTECRDVPLSPIVVTPLTAPIIRLLHRPLLSASARRRYAPLRRSSPPSPHTCLLLSRDALAFAFALTLTPRALPRA